MEAMANQNLHRFFGQSPGKGFRTLSKVCIWPCLPQKASLEFHGAAGAGLEKAQARSAISLRPRGTYAPVRSQWSEDVFNNSSAAGKIIFSHSAYSLADGCKPSFATNDLSWPIFLLSGKISTTSNPRFRASSVTIWLSRRI